MPRTAIYPYVTRDDAIADRRGNSDYVNELKEWTTEKSARGTMFKTRYKVPFRWNDRVVILRIENASGSFAIAVNGQEAGYSASSEGMVEFDLTKLSVENYNDLTVELFDNPKAAEIENSRRVATPSIGRATILSQPKVRVRDLSVETSVSEGTGLLNLGIVMESHLLNAKNYTIWYELLSPEGKCVAESHRDLTTKTLSQDTVCFFANIPDVMAWSHRSPYLYTLVVKTQYEGRYKEYVPLRIGFRSLSYMAGLFAINGKVIELAPTDDGSVGEDAEKDLKKIADKGYNAIMVARPRTDEFYTACDKVGMYVCDATDIDTSSWGDNIGKGGNPSNDPQWTAAYIDRAEQMYHRSKVHPSVIAFATAHNSANGICLYESYLAIKRLEKTRPIYYADAKGEWNSDAIRFSDPAPLSAPEEPTVERTTRGSVTISNPSPTERMAGTVSCKLNKGRKEVATLTKEFGIAPEGSYTFTIPVEQIGDDDPKKYEAQITVTRREIPYCYDPSAQIVEREVKKLQFKIEE